jgi:hypothetical protein
MNPYENYENDDDDQNDSSLHGDSLLEPVVRPSSSSFSIFNNGKLPRRGEKSGDYNCQFCEKSFKYAKPFQNHMMLHQDSDEIIDTNYQPSIDEKKGRGRPAKPKILPTRRSSSQGLPVSGRSSPVSYQPKSVNTLQPTSAKRGRGRPSKSKTKPSKRSASPEDPPSPLTNSAPSSPASYDPTQDFAEVNPATFLTRKLKFI